MLLEDYNSLKIEFGGKHKRSAYAVKVTHKPSQLVVHCNDTRSTFANYTAAMDLMEILIEQKKLSAGKPHDRPEHTQRP